MNYHDLCQKLHQSPAFYRYRREFLLRETVANMLCRAVESLPKGYGLSILEGWRPPHIQRRMYRTTWRRYAEMHPNWSDIQIKRVVNRLTAPVDNPKVPPPHSTGAALDLSLVREDGTPVDLRSPFERWDHHGYWTDAKGLSDEAARNRAILREALESSGLTNYPSEWWHWSYGDQGWAYRTGAPHAIYGALTPENWSPDPADDIDQPLEATEEG